MAGFCIECNEDSLLVVAKVGDDLVAVDDRGVGCSPVGVGLLEALFIIPSPEQLAGFSIKCGEGYTDAAAGDGTQTVTLDCSASEPTFKGNAVLSPAVNFDNKNDRTLQAS